MTLSIIDIIYQVDTGRKPPELGNNFELKFRLKNVGDSTVRSPIFGIELLDGMKVKLERHLSVGFQGAIKMPDVDKASMKKLKTFLRMADASR